MHKQVAIPAGMASICAFMFRHNQFIMALHSVLEQVGAARRVWSPLPDLFVAQ